MRIHPKHPESVAYRNGRKCNGRKQNLIVGGHRVYSLRNEMLG